MYEFWGRHSLCNMDGIYNIDLNNSEYFIGLLRDAVNIANATLVDTVHHNFVPQGMSVIAVLKESHVAVHTYPEYNALFLDVFTCGKHTDPEVIVEYFIDKLNPKHQHTRTIVRSMSEFRGKSF